MAIDICNIVPKQFFDMVVGRKRHLVLAHKLLEDPAYFAFYKQEAKTGSIIYLDNSNYEKGDKWCTPNVLTELHEMFETPDNVYLMAPEVAFDGGATSAAVSSFKNTLKEKGKEKIKLFGTIHGKSFYEVKSCYQHVSRLVDLIGFSYRISCSDIIVRHPHSNIARGMMRSALITLLDQVSIIDENKPHHLLGISDPCELYEQQRYQWLVSADSSTAYIHAKHFITFSNAGLGGHNRVEEKIDFDEVDPNYGLRVRLSENINVLDLFGKGEKLGRN